MKIRFKTKQELLETDGVGYGFGLGNTHLGELATNNQITTYSNKAFTTTPHPYEGKSFKIRVTPEESEKVQKKAFKLGWKWHDGDTVVVGYNLLYINHSNQHGYLGGGNNESFFRRESATELTPEQFLDGDLPDRCGKITHEFSCYQLDGTQIGEKTDAYIDRNGDVYLRSLEGKTFKAAVELSELHEFNILSEKEFKAKHTDKLKFKEWDVEVFDKGIKVGCQEFRKVDIKRFLEFAAKCTRERPAHGLSMDEVLGFLVNNKIKLGL